MNFLNQLLEDTSDPIPTNHYEDIQEAIIESSLDPIEAAPLLIGVAVAINSQSYWTDAKNVVLNPWYIEYGSGLNIKTAVQTDLLATVYAAIILTVFSFVENGVSETLNNRTNWIGTSAAIHGAAASAANVVFFI